MRPFVRRRGAAARATLQRVGCGLLVAGLAGGCAGAAVPLSELSPEVIAVHYRDPETARRRAEAVMDPKERRQREQERFGTLGVVPVDEVQGVLEGIFGTRDPNDPQSFEGRLAFLEPRTGELRVSNAARRGARPRDWSPDRSRLLLAQYERDALQLYEYDLESGDVRPLTRGRTAHPDGCFGPDGRLVVQTVRFDAGGWLSRIELTDPGGVNPRPLSPGPADRSPACAADGSSVVYVSGPEGREQLFVISPVDGGTPRVLLPGRDPSFSKDGWVVFSARVAGRWQLFRVRPDGSGRSRIGSGVLDAHLPSASPDGQHVVYVVEEANRSSLYLRRLDGSGDRILFRDGDALYPIW